MFAERSSKLRVDPGTGAVVYGGDTTSSASSDTTDSEEMSDTDEEGHELCTPPPDDSLADPFSSGGEGGAFGVVQDESRGHFRASRFYRQKKRKQQKVGGLDPDTAALVNGAVTRTLRGGVAGSRGTAPLAGAPRTPGAVAGSMSPSEQPSPRLAAGTGLPSEKSGTVDVRFAPLKFVRPKKPQGKDNSNGLHCPPHLTHASLTGFRQEGCVVLFGGQLQDGSVSSATWLYDLGAQRWSLLPPVPGRVPAPRCGHCAVAISIVPPPLGLKATAKRTTAEAAKSSVPEYHPTLIVFGGSDLRAGMCYNDVWAFDVRQRGWKCLHDGRQSLVTPHAPSQNAVAALQIRDRHTLPQLRTSTPPPSAAPAPQPRWRAVCGLLEQRLFVFGGESAVFAPLDDLHLFDCTTNQWRAIRQTTPWPSARFMHTGTTVADKLVILGGIGRDPATPLTDDTWVLDMRTTMWRRIAGLGGPAGGTRRSFFGGRRPLSPNAGPLPQSPFAPPGSDSDDDGLPVHSVRTSSVVSSTAHSRAMTPLSTPQDARVAFGGVGGGSAGLGSARAPPAARASRRSLEGHVALGFDDLVLVHGGRRANGRGNPRLYVLDVPNEQWTKLPAPARGASLASPDIHGRSRLPPPTRTGHCACVMQEFNVTAAMDLALPLTSLAKGGIHFTEDKETGQYIDALEKLLKQQTSFEGMLTTHGGRPLMSRTVCGFLFGGGSQRKQFSDCYCVDLKVCLAATQDVNRGSLLPDLPADDDALAL